MANALQATEQRKLSEREAQERKVGAMLELLPDNADGERFKAFALAVLRDPALASCSEKSKLLALADCAKLGLYPDKNLGHVWLVPFRNKGVLEVTLIPGYQGYIELARRSGAVKSVHADIVYEHDEFRVWTDDNGRHLLHQPDTFGERGKAVGVYCLATMASGPPQIEVMSWEEVMKVRGRSKAASSGPWVTDLEMMARKSVVRRARKYWPQSPELALLGAHDDALDSTIVEGQVVSAAPKRVSRSALMAPPAEAEQFDDGEHAEDASQVEPDEPGEEKPRSKSKRQPERAPDGAEIPEGLFGNTPNAAEA